MERLITLGQLLIVLLAGCTGSNDPVSAPGSTRPLWHKKGKNEAD